MYNYDVVSLPTFSTSVAVKTWDVSSFTQVAVHCWFSGQPNGWVKLLVYFDNLEYGNEVIMFNSGGVASPGRVYPVFAPTMSIVLSRPSGSMQADVRVYTACCGVSKTGKSKKPLPLNMKTVRPPLDERVVVLNPPRKPLNR